MKDPKKYLLQTPTFTQDIFGSIDRFDEIESWLKDNEFHYLGKTGKVEYYDFGRAEPITGFDIPVLIKNGDKSNLIIIVGESPLRKGSEPKFLVGFPFAVDYEEEPYQCKVYKELFNRLLEKDYNLYITDIIKLWNKSKSKNLNVTPEDKEVLNGELTILSRMYEKIHILLMGSNAQKWEVPEKVENCEITKIEIPHMSQRNWHTWKIKIYEETFMRLIKENKITQKNIEGLLNDTNEPEFRSMDAETVADTAFKMISSELN